MCNAALAGYGFADGPERFQGRGVDWPISYDDLEPYYRDAERILGVSADVGDQKNFGVWFPDDYEYLDTLHDVAVRGIYTRDSHFRESKAPLIFIAMDIRNPMDIRCPCALSGRTSRAVR